MRHCQERRGLVLAGPPWMARQMSGERTLTGHPRLMDDLDPTGGGADAPSPGASRRKCLA